MTSVDKADLARAGTMEATSKEGRAYLEKNLTEWKKPLLIDPDTKGASSSNAAGKGRGGKKANTRDDDDSDDEGPGAKKAKMAKATTMEVTAKEGKGLLGSQKLGDTRQVTKAKQKAAVKRTTTVDKCVADAKAVFGNVSTSGGRSMRKRAPPKAASPTPKKPAAKKAAMKKAGTMQKTAKEAAGLLKGEDLGDTRLVTKAKRKKTAAAKKSKKGGKKKSK